MPIVREKKRWHYLIVDQRACDDLSLSWAAKGLLMYLLGRPDNWQVNVKHLARCGVGGGRDKIYRLLNELIEHGYAERIAVRGDNGRMADYGYVIYEVGRLWPVDNSGVVPSPLPEIPCTALPETAAPYPVNTTLPITDHKKSLFIVASKDKELGPVNTKIDTMCRWKLPLHNLN